MPDLNPVLMKELRSRMRGARAFVVLTIYLLILGGFTLMLYAGTVDVTSNGLNAGRYIGKSLFFMIVTVALIEVCVITPTLTAASISSEKEHQTYDLLISSLLSPWQIAWGKLGAALSFAFLMILAVVPMMSLAFLFGGVSLAEVLIALIALMTTAVFYATIGFYCSTLVRSTLAANSVAIGSIILKLLGIPFIVLVFSIISSVRSHSEGIGTYLKYIHPFIALIDSETSIMAGDGPWFTTYRSSSNTGSVNIVSLPSPWIIYFVLALLCSSVLLWLSVRRLRPVQTAPVRAITRQNKREGEVA